MANEAERVSLNAKLHMVRISFVSFQGLLFV